MGLPFTRVHPKTRNYPDTFAPIWPCLASTGSRSKVLDNNMCHHWIYKLILICCIPYPTMYVNMQNTMSHADDASGTLSNVLIVSLILTF